MRGLIIARRYYEMLPMVPVGGYFSISAKFCGDCNKMPKL